MLKNSIPVLATSLVAGPFVGHLCHHSLFLILFEYVIFCLREFVSTSHNADGGERKQSECLLAGSAMYRFLWPPRWGSKGIFKALSPSYKKTSHLRDAFHKIEGTPSFSSLRLSRSTGAPTRGKTAGHLYLI